MEDQAHIQRAHELQRVGKSIRQIATELQVSKSKVLLKNKSFRFFCRNVSHLDFIQDYRKAIKNNIKAEIILKIKSFKVTNLYSSFCLLNGYNIPKN